jgi:hypothetical protein
MDVTDRQPMSGPLAHDEDGNALPAPEPRSDLSDLIQLMEYARKRGFRIGPMVRCGKLTLQIQDLRQSEGRGKMEPEKSIWEEHGYEE